MQLLFASGYRVSQSLTKASLAAKPFLGTCRAPARGFGLTPSSTSLIRASSFRRAQSRTFIIPRDSSWSRTGTSRNLQSRLDLVLLGVLGTSLGIGLSVQYLNKTNQQPPEPTQDADASKIFADMSTEISPGRPGNLTPEQEEKLRRLWQMIFQVCGVEVEEADDVANSTPAPSLVQAETNEAKKPKKKRITMFSRKSKKEAEPEPTLPTPMAGLPTPKEGDDDKYGQTKHFYDTLATQTPDSIRETIWGMVKHDHPDALVLRFLRARKWDVEKALVMLISTMNWRRDEMRVDDDIMASGDGAALEAEQGTDAEAKKMGHDFLSQIRMGKSFVHGVDKNGRPICIVRVRLHKQGEQAEQSLERYTVWIIETCRMLLQPPVDTAVSGISNSRPWILVINADVFPDYYLRHDWLHNGKHGT
jgi:hypothetical protein